MNTSIAEHAAGKPASLEGASVKRASRKLGAMVEILGTIVMIAISLLVYHTTGLHSGAESPVLKVVMGIAIAYWFVLNFRVACMGDTGRTTAGTFHNEHQRQP